MKKNTSSTVTAKPAPQRTCTACRKVKDKKELVRLVRTPEGKIELDITGKKAGRGAYICRDRVCWDNLAKGKQLEHAFKSVIHKGDLEQLIRDGKERIKE
jgi:predicted RNA-binding protein YlxR (DUF448 family)